MSEEDGLYGAFRPIVQCISQHLHRHLVVGKVIACKHHFVYPLYNIPHMAVLLLIVSLTELLAHIIVMAPMLLVIVTKVAFARSSLLASALFS